MRWSGQRILLPMGKWNRFDLGEQNLKPMHIGEFGQRETILRVVELARKRVLAMHRWIDLHCEPMRWNVVLAPGVENLLDREATPKNRHLQLVPMQKRRWMHWFGRLKLPMLVQVWLHRFTLRVGHWFLLEQPMLERWKMRVTPKWLQLCLPR